MNEAHRIRTAFLASLSFHEDTPEERTRKIELALDLADGEAGRRFSFEVAERLTEAGTLERVDRFQRDGKAFVRYRHPGSGETFLLPVAAAAGPEISLARTHRPHWHARSRLLYRSLSHLIAVERKLFVRDERNLEYLQTDLGDILRTIVGSAREVLECDEVRLYSLSRRPEEVRYLQPLNDGEPWNRALAEEWVGRRMLPLYVDDLAENGTVQAVVDAEAMDATVHVGVAPYTAAAPEDGFRSMAMARVGDPATPFQYVLEAWSRTPRFFHDERIGILGIVAEHATDLLTTLKKLGMLVMIDELTGIYNRPYFSRQLDTEIARAYREERPMSLIIADIDDFKHVNDTYGYEAGNALLRELSQTLAGSVRPFDTVARWGGEEFALILSAETTKAEAREICERLRLKVQNLTLVVPGLDGRDNTVRVTMSIGGAMFPADVPVTWDRSRGLDRPQREKLAHDLWTRANMNLRASKERGKNQVTYTGD
ncbi:MAG TPA: GGDEF domain-containing protein [Candidatus Eisenbacteria bacterium]|nr:GGDEF domain-containing protein [Candidatus Eisenbacteria bacterium]